MTVPKHTSLIAVSSILFVLSLFLHLYKLGEIPPGLHVDESSISYNAFCILKTGRDEHGQRLPLFFKCFGDYKNPLKIYMLVPLIKFFGMEKNVVRTLSVIFHLVSAFLFFFLAFKYSRNHWIAVLSAFIFSILPWSFPVSRLLFGHTIFLCFFIMSCISIFRSIGSDKYKIKYSLFAGLLLGITMYSTQSARPAVFFLLLSIFLSLSKLSFKRKKALAIMLFVFLLLLIPMIMVLFFHPETFTNRFNAISVWRDSAGVVSVISRIFQRYIEYYGIFYLFIGGDPNIVHNIPGFGELFIFLLPLILIGFYALIINFRNNFFYRFLIWNLIFYPIAATLTIGRMHSTACLAGTIYWTLLAVVGAKFAVQIKKKIYKSIIFICVFSLATYEIPAYFHRYFYRYPDESRAVFDAPIIEAIASARKMLGDGETLYLSRFLFFPMNLTNDFKPEWYAHLLFILKIPPEEFIASGSIPQKYAVILNGKIKNTGILIRLNKLLISDEKGFPVIMENYDQIDTVPVNSRKIHSEITKSGISIDFYRIEP